MNLPVVYEDADLLVIEKPAGLATHGSRTDGEKSSVASLLSAKIDDQDTERAGIVHRLDKDTSGLLVVAKNTPTREFLQAQFKRREVQKTYLAAVKGRPKHEKARLEWPIARSPKNPLKRSVRPDGKMAITEYHVIETRGGNSLLEVKLLTGRTHQIRVHMNYLGHPVLADKLYGQPCRGLNRQFLHASSLGFKLPDGEWRFFESSLPSELQSFWSGLV